VQQRLHRTMRQVSTANLVQWSSMQTHCRVQHASKDWQHCRLAHASWSSRRVGAVVSTSSFCVTDSDVRILRQ
jgi:hypothetical protein